MFGELMRWDPRDELSSWHRDIDDLFGRFFGRGELPLMSRWVPPMDAYRKDDKYVVRFDLPGVDPKDLDIHAEGDLLTIKGERKTEEKGREYREAFYGRFERTVRLPGGVDPEKIAARYENGVLEISVPLPKELVGRSIPVQVEAEGRKIEHKAA